MRKTLAYRPPAFLSPDTFQDQAVDKKARMGMGASVAASMGVWGGRDLNI